MPCTERRGTPYEYRRRRRNPVLSVPTSTTVENIRRRCLEEGPQAAISDRTRPDRPSKRKLDGAGEAKLITLACSQPPEGRTQWTLQLLADELVALKLTDSISYETVRRTLKKTS